MATALSMASLVPEPIEKCAVAAASPISTTFRCDHFWQSTRGKFSQAEPRICPAFDDKCRRVGVELVSVRPDPAVLGFFEDESKRVIEFLIGGKPDEFVLARVDGRLEIIREFGACLGIQAIRRDDEIVVLGEFAGAGDLGPKYQFHAKRTGALLQ